MKDCKVICLGEALVDRLGPYGGDPSIDKPVQDCLGGAPANVASALKRLGIDVAFVGCLGDDDIGRKFQNLFLSRGVNIEALQINPTLPSRIVLVKRDHSGERNFGGFNGNKGNGFADQFLELSAVKNICLKLIKQADWLVLGTIPLAYFKSRETALWLIDQAQKKQMNIAIDVNWRPTFWDENLTSDTPPNTEICSLVHSVLEKVSWIKLAKEEAIWFFNSTEARQIAESFPNKPNVIITDGANPIQWYIDGLYGQVDAISPPKIIDTTGAGDSFMSGLIAQLCFNNSVEKDYLKIEKIIRFAAACGALVCMAEGAIDPQPTFSEVEEFLSQFS